MKPIMVSPHRSLVQTNRALRAARELRAGTVTVNCFGEGDITTPFGGINILVLAGATTVFMRMINIAR